MSSSNRIDYSIRQNKSIERGIVFEGIRKIYDRLSIGPQALYVGFGSVWFTDFHIAHRQIGIDDMISLEFDEITAVRAEFNKPYRTVSVLPGDSMDLIPELLERSDLKKRPWVTWLDFDKALDEDRLQQLDDLVRYLPDNSFLVTTFSATPGQYGKPHSRPDRLATLFGFSMPTKPSPDEVREEDDLAQVLSRTTLNRLVSLALSFGRVPAIPTFRLCYRDGVTMVTVGLFLPSAETEPITQATVCVQDWAGIVDEPITTPPLTAREVAALRALLPMNGTLQRADVQACGFDLEDDQIASFANHYTRYPSFAQLAL